MFRVPEYIIRFDSTIESLLLKFNIPYESIPTNTGYTISKGPNTGTVINYKAIHVTGISKVELSKIIDIRSVRFVEITPSNIVEATAYFRTLSCPIKTYKPTNDNLDNICNKLLQRDKKVGFILGENHTHFNSKLFLIRNMQNLYNLGVRTLFLEHFMYNTIMQRDLDAPAESNFFNEYVDEFESHNYRFRELIETAKQHNIRIVGIDTDVSYNIPNGVDRRVAMNFVATKIIEAERGSDKYVALVGESHISKVDDGCIGIADILDIPSVLFYTRKPTSAPIQIDVRGLKIGTTTIAQIDYVIQEMPIKEDDDIATMVEAAGGAAAAAPAAAAPAGSAGGRPRRSRTRKHSRHH